MAVVTAVKVVLDDGTKQFFDTIAEAVAALGSYDPTPQEAAPEPAEEPSAS